VKESAVAKTIVRSLLFLLTGPYSTVLPFALLPWISRFVAERFIHRGDFASLPLRLRAIFSGVAACIPGVVTLSLFFFGAGCLFHAVPDDFDCHMEMYGPLVIVSGIVLRAYALLVCQALRVRHLLASTKPASEALTLVAHGLDVSLVELPTEVPACMVLGVLCPRVVVSTGMLHSFSKEELRAALWHERSHIERGDTRYNLLIAFLSDCGIWRVRNALREYKLACEELADERATHRVSRVVLAETLIRFVRLSWHPPFAEALAEEHSLQARVRSLLNSAAMPSNAARVPLPWTLLSLCGLMVCYPIIARHLGALITHCL
jgi:Zn-dependent protease with chaperone function